MTELPDYWADEVERSEEEWQDDDSAEKLAEKALSVLQKEWTGPHEGPRGGTYWEHTQTGEQRYQENEPQPLDGDEEAAGGEGAESGSEPAGDSGGQEPESQAQEAVEVASGVYAEIEPLESPGDLELGDLLIVAGEKVEAKGTSMEGPDGREYVSINYEGQTMTVPVEDVEGEVGYQYHAFDYDVENEWEMKFADSINRDEWSEQGADGFMGVRAIQHHASDVDNPEILGDAIVKERNSARSSKNAIGAMESRLRALGEDPDDWRPEPEPEPEPGGAQFTPDEHDNWAEEFDPGAAEEVKGLWELKDEAEAGVSEHSMQVHTLDDGTKAFLTNYDSTRGDLDSMRSKYRDEIITIHGFGVRDDLADAVVPVAHDEENGDWVAGKEFGNEDTPAKEASNTPSDWADEIDHDEALRKLGVMAIAGAGDLHHDNIMVSEDGELGFHDLDHAGGNVSSGEGYFPASRAGETLAELLEHQDYDELPDNVQSRLDRDTWENWGGGFVPHEITSAFKKAVSDGAREKAKELVEEAGGIHEAGNEYFRDPDQSYNNDQKSMNDKIWSNLKQAYKDYENYGGLE